MSDFQILGSLEEHLAPHALGLSISGWAWHPGFLLSPALVSWEVLLHYCIFAIFLFSFSGISVAWMVDFWTGLHMFLFFSLFIAISGFLVFSMLSPKPVEFLVCGHG